MIKELMRLKHAQPTRNINYLTIPVTVFNTTKEGAEEFNKFYFFIKGMNLPYVQRTPSGGIKNGRGSVRPAWDLKITRNCIEILALLPFGSWRIQFRTELPEGMSGRKAFTAFKKYLKKKNIDLEDFAIENGDLIKKEIEKPLIGAVRRSYYDVIFENVNHIDFHSSYAGGLANTHPEFKEILVDLYNKREEKQEYKNILNFSIGFMQSEKCCRAKWANLSRDAIKDNNERVRKLAEILEKKGRIVISFNTDGIWYKGSVYHGEGEGTGLGEWHNDHINCKFRAKSAGSYEFIENGIYFPVVRGVNNDIKKNWSWGSIYSKEAEPETFIFTEEGGVVVNA